MGKCDSLGYATMSFSRNVVVETSYQMLEILSICEPGKCLPSFNKGNCTNFIHEKSTMELSVVPFFENISKKITLRQISY